MFLNLYSIGPALHTFTALFSQLSWPLALEGKAKSNDCFAF